MLIRWLFPLQGKFKKSSSVMLVCMLLFFLVGSFAFGASISIVTSDIFPLQWTQNVLDIGHIISTKTHWDYKVMTLDVSVDGKLPVQFDFRLDGANMGRYIGCYFHDATGAVVGREELFVFIVVSGTMKSSPIMITGASYEGGARVSVTQPSTTIEIWVSATNYYGRTPTNPNDVGFELYKGWPITYLQASDNQFKEGGNIPINGSTSGIPVLGEDVSAPPVDDSWVFEVKKKYSGDVPLSNFSNRQDVVGWAVARKAAGSSTMPGEVNVTFDPDEFKFTSEKSPSKSFPYDLWFGNEQVGYLPILWPGLDVTSADSRTKDISIRCVDPSMIDMLPEGKYSTTVHIEFSPIEHK